MEPPVPRDEDERLAELRRLQILDTAPEVTFDDLARLAGIVFAAPIALVSLVDTDRQWFKARVGLAAPQTDRRSSFCGHAIVEPDRLLVVEDALADPRFADNPLVTGGPRIRFYAGAAIVAPGGTVPGTVCVIDTVPHTPSAEQREALRALARQAGTLLELRKRSQDAEVLLEHQQRNEEANRGIAERLALALSGGDLGLWDLDVTTGSAVCNDQWWAMFGYQPREFEMIDGLWKRMVHPDDWSSAHAALVSHIKGDSPVYEHDLRMRHKDGSWVWIQDRAKVVVRDAQGRALRVVGVNLNISDRKRAESALLNEQLRLQTISDNMPVLIAEFDADRRFTFSNATYGAWLGVDPKAMLGRRLADISRIDLFGPREAHLERAFHGERVSFEQQAALASGIRHLQTTYIPRFDTDGVVEGIYALTNDISELKEQQHRLHRLAREDALTGLPNRRVFEQHLAEAMARTERSRMPMAVLFLDVDRFKTINDSWGHAAGDAVLKEFGSRVRSSVRSTDLVARYAGDEFVLVLEGLGRADEATIVATKVIDAMAAPFSVFGEDRPVTTSIGIAVYAGDATKPEALMSRADAALYDAKRAGRNRYGVAR